jgi:hypothetical protein
MKKHASPRAPGTTESTVAGQCLCGDVKIEIGFPARWAWHDHTGTPICYERARSPHMVNVPRALFKLRTGRQPRYHIGIEQAVEWGYFGERLVPLKGFPGVVWDRSKRKPRLPAVSGAL